MTTTAAAPAASAASGSPAVPGMSMADRLPMVLIALLISFLAIYPVAWLLYGSFFSAAPLQEGHLTLDNYVRAYSDPILLSTTVNTLVFSFGQMVVAVAIGTGLGWVVSRTNTPGRQTFEVLLIVLFLVPTLLAIVAWTLLLSPWKGLINSVVMAALGLDESPFNVYSMGGMIFVQGLYLSPFAYLIIAPAFTSIDSGLEEAARMSGSSPLQTFARVTLPVVRPAILSAAILMFIFGLESFDIPQLLGARERIFTYTSLIYAGLEVRTPADYGFSTALSTSLLVTTAICVFLYQRSIRHVTRFQTITGKGYRAAIVDIGRWKWVAFAVCCAFFFITIVLPLAIILLGSFMTYFGRFDWGVFDRLTLENYPRIFNHPQLVEGFFNSVTLALTAGTVCVVLAAAVAFISVKTRLRGRKWLDAVAMLPISFPSTVLGVALLWAWISIPLPIYGTLLILGVAYVTRYLPICLRTVIGGVVQISDEMEAASKMCGASWLLTFRRIILPLLKPTLIAAWLMLFLIFMRELSMSIILSGPGNPVISVVMFDYYESGELPPLAATSFLLIAVTVAVVLISRRIFKVRYSEMRM